MFFVIKVGPRFYISRFNPMTKLVESTKDLAEAKKFISTKMANKFITKYANQGYGLARNECTIFPLGEVLKGN